MTWPPHTLWGWLAFIPAGLILGFMFGFGRAAGYDLWRHLFR